MSWAHYPSWSLFTKRPHGSIAWYTGEPLLLSCSLLRHRHRRNAVPPSARCSSSKPSGAPLVKGRPFRIKESLKNKKTLNELTERQAVLGKPPAAPTRRGRRNGPRLSPEQARVVELAAQGRNIFYTGPAGCGKSTVLRAVVQRLQALGKRVEVMAPTGKAALAINGMTTWTFAGWNPNSHKVSLEGLRKAATYPLGTAYRRLRRTDVIIIDEISMVENLHFERLNQVMKVARVGTSFAAEQLPFGGVQVIVTGDFAQLPPVRPFKYCYACGSEIQLGIMQETHNCRLCKISYRAIDQWAFRSKAWEECDFAHVHLKTIHRQRDNIFISMLQKCRLGDPFTPEEIDLLMNHEAETTGAVELYSTREEVRAVNEREFNKLSTTRYSFKCHDTFIWNKDKHPHLAKKGERHPHGWLTCLKGHSMDRQVELKRGMRVMLLTNLNLDKGLCNGSQGEIIGWTAPCPQMSDEPPGGTTYSAGAVEYMQLKLAQIAAFEKAADPAVWPIVRFTNGIERIIRAECMVEELGDDAPYSLVCRTQIPLMPAWALSIHKAQGMTLDRVKVDLSRAFSEGQVYVALSRATSLQGLKVVGDPKGLMVGKGGNKEVRAFYREKFGL